MKRHFLSLLLLAGLLLPWAAFGTTTVTGTLKNLGTSSPSSGAFVRFYLRGCAGNQPTIPGVGILAPTQGAVWFQDFPANGSGVISGTLYSTRDATGLLGGDIECGGSFTAVWYGMVIFQAGKAGPEVAVHAKNGATLDISSVTPISVTPVVPAPTGDSTYARLDGGNQPFVGAITAPNVTATSTVTDAITNATTGYRIGGTAPSGHVLRGNGTNYIDAILAISDLSGSVMCSILPALTGDVTTSAGSCASTVGKVNGVSYGASPSSNTVPVVTGVNTVTYEAVPNAALANASTTVNGQTCTLGSSCTVPVVAILAQSTTTSLDNTSIPNSNTTVIHKAVTMPSSGCPCRVIASWWLYLSVGGSGQDVAYVSDGTAGFAGSETATAGSASGFGFGGSGGSTITYANNANVTFNLIMAGSHSGSTTVSTTQLGTSITGAPASSLNLLVLSSN